MEQVRVCSPFGWFRFLEMVPRSTLKGNSGFFIFNTRKIYIQKTYNKKPSQVIPGSETATIYYIFIYCIPDIFIHIFSAITIGKSYIQQQTD